MEVTKDNYFDVKYNDKRDVLEVKNKNIAKRNKFIVGVLSATGIIVMINLLLIYKFFQILFTL